MKPTKRQVGKPKLEQKKSLLLHNYDLFLHRQTRLAAVANSNNSIDSDEISEKRQLLILDDVTIFAIAARRLLDLCGLISVANRMLVNQVAFDPNAKNIVFKYIPDTGVGFETLLNRLLHMSNFLYFDNPRYLRAFLGRKRSEEEWYAELGKADERIDGVFLLFEKRHGVGIYLLRDLVEASIPVAEKIIDVCGDAGVYLDFMMKP